MLSRIIGGSHSVGRLRGLLALFFLLLAIPTTVLIWQTYSQLKWESFHQYRGAAEELSRRIDSRLREVVSVADARSFADYHFLVVGGDPSANFLRPSPLSGYPVVGDIPGTIGYFQVDTEGNFTTPLLPASAAPTEKLGIGDIEYADRQALALQIHTILADNRLVSARPASGRRQTLQAKASDGESAEIPGKAPDKVFAAISVAARRDTADGQEQALADADSVAEVVVTGERKRSVEDSSAAEDSARGLSEQRPATSAPGLEPAADPDTLADDERGRKAAVVATSPASSAASLPSTVYTQGVFDNLNQAPATTSADKWDAGKVADMNAYLKKSEMVERELESDSRAAAKVIAEDRPAIEEARSNTPQRQLRKEKTTVPEFAANNAPVPASDTRGTVATADAAAGVTDSLGLANGAMDLAEPRLSVRTFESEVDPFEFSMLDSGHFVLFRKVWRDGERFIQGMLIDRSTFLQELLNRSFYDTALGTMSNLQVMYQGGELLALPGSAYARYASGRNELDGTLLYVGQLTAPFGNLDLRFRINSLPPGPGAGVLGWLTLVIALVFVGSFVVLYRLGLSQINLARQQQDFVSAVSHELKTPLTSIRMYSEMLKEGWASDEKRHGYYEYIHDESERLSRLISNVLQLARITRNEPQFDMKPASVAELVSQVESRVANQVDRAGFEIAIECDTASADKRILIDADCFLQIIINLVDNAIKFSKNAERKNIVVNAVMTGDDRVTFSVRDFGPGIANDQLKKIFTLFYRTESELTRETVGTGIGLAIVHQLTLAMGGKVDVINRKPGVEFLVSFRLADS